MNYLESKKKLKQYLLARIPFISITTTEINRAENILKELAKEINIDIMINSMSKGTINLLNNQKLDESKNIIGVLDYISEQIKIKENQTYVLTDISEIDSETVTSRYLYDIVSIAEEHNGTIIVVKDTSIWTNLQRMGMNIELSLPNEEELRGIISDSLNYYKNQIKLEWNEEDYKEAATTLLGLSEIEVKNIMSSLIASGEVTKEDLIDLKYAKDQMFDNINGLEKIEVDPNLAFGGLENLKDWLNEKKKLLEPNKREKMLKHNIKPPRGMLVVGVPGCGKSLTAKAISAMWQLPLYLLDFATVQGMYVGQSEKQLKEALSTAEQVSPCILWIDEIEKGLSAKSDGGVTNRMIGQFLFWLQECKKEVFVVATANDITTLPPELFRKGRFDEIFFVDLPNKVERKDIIKQYLNKYLSINVNDDFMNKLVELTEGFSGSDIESVMREIAYSLVSTDAQLTQNLIIDKINKTVSISKTNPESINTIRAWGNEHAAPASKQD